METNTKPIAMPLDESIHRCLAHGDIAGDWCDRRYQCAAHETIKHDDYRMLTQTAYRKCNTDAWVGYLPIAGFPSDAEAA